MVALFHTYLTTPIYNLLVFLVGIIPGGDVGVAVILVTIAVRLILLPLSISAVRTQRAMRVVEPEVNAIKKKYANNKEMQAKEMLAVYRKYRIKPFASFLTMFIQLPVLFALYWVFKGESLLGIDVAVLYSFVTQPEVISPLFLGVLPVVGKSIVLGVVAGIAQFFQAYFAIPVPQKKEGGTSSMSQDFGRAMALQARYVFPLLIGFIAYETSGAIALYFITTSVVTIVQELLMKKTVAPVTPEEPKEKTA